MTHARPFLDSEALFSCAEEVAQRLTTKDWLEAFSRHPRIGDRAVLQAKFAPTRDWSQEEQSGVEGMPAQVLDQLLAGNLEYEKKFGHVFLVCATGKTALEMLSLLQERLKNGPELELKIASAEQRKITRIRLEKLLGETKTS